MRGCAKGTVLCVSADWVHGSCGSHVILNTGDASLSCNSLSIFFPLKVIPIHPQVEIMNLQN